MAALFNSFANAATRAARRVLQGLLFATVCLAPAAEAAPLVYDFSYTPGLSDPIHPFHFNILAPGPLSNNQTLSFAPYVISDGSHTFQITHGITAPAGPNACFNFGTASTTFSGCSGSINAPGAGYEAIFNGGIPVLPGVYTSTASGIFNGGSGAEFADGVLMLKVALAPLLRYHFTYHPGAGDPLQPFSFSFVSTPLSNSQTLVFDPYKVSDGTDWFTFVQGITAHAGPNACFNFGTASTTLIGCSGSINAPGAGYEAIFNGGIPVLPGVYTSTASGIFNGGSGAKFADGTLTLDLTLADVPEPATVLLFAFGAAAAFRRRRRA